MTVRGVITSSALDQAESDAPGRAAVMIGIAVWNACLLFSVLVARTGDG
jgi:uncharacterized membrane protein